jgi:hypothetical protein
MVSWFDIIEPRQAVASVPRKVNSEREVAFAAWRDMVDEPEKYGSDLENEWLALDAELRAGPGHWRLEAHWLSKEAELEEALANAQLTWRDIFTRVARLAAQKGEREWFRRDVHRILKANRKAARKQVKVANKAATKIQAAIRGHLARSNANFRDCCMCLAHTVCPLLTDVGMMCRACAEQGPHEDTTGPVADPWNWFRADYVDLAACPDDCESDYGSDSESDADYIPEPRGERNRLHEFGHNRLFKCDWEQGNTGTCLWCGATFKRPYSGMFEGPNEFGYCSDECDRNRCCWLRMKWAGKKGPLDHEWLAGLKEGVVRDSKRACPSCNVCDDAPATEKISGVLYCDNCLDDQESCRECQSLFLKGTGPGLGFCSRECQRY